MIRRHRQSVALAVCAALALQQTAFAVTPSYKVVDGIRVYEQVKDLSLSGNQLHGAIVDVNGKPVVGASVVVGHQGKVVASTKTDEQGRFACADMKPGIHQVATFGGVRTYNLWNAESAPKNSLKGSIHVLDDEAIKRGNACDSGCDDCGSGGKSPLAACVTNPIVWAAVIAAAIAIPLALDDDDAS